MLLSHLAHDTSAMRKHIEDNPKWCSTPLVDFSNELPLHQSILNDSSFEVTRIILQAYPPAVKYVDNGGNTPLHCACAAGDLQVVQLLLEYKECDPTSLNKENAKPIDILKSSNLNFINQDDLNKIEEILRVKEKEIYEVNERQLRKDKREAMWCMKEKDAWFYVSIHGNIPLHFTSNELLSNYSVDGLQMSGVTVISELSHEEDFNIYIKSMENMDDNNNNNNNNNGNNSGNSTNESVNDLHEIFLKYLIDYCRYQEKCVKYILKIYDDKEKENIL